MDLQRVIVVQATIAADLYVQTEQAQAKVIELRELLAQTMGSVRLIAEELEQAEVLADVHRIVDRLNCGADEIARALQ